MPYRVRWEANIGLIDDLQAYLDSFHDLVEERAQAAYKEIEPSLLDELQYYPSPPSYPYGQFPWKSERQRKFVLALLRRMAIERGDFVEGPRGGKVITNLKYVRSFDLRDAWQLDLAVREGRIVLTISNTAQNDRGSYIAQFVVGTLNQRSRREAAEPQQPFHSPRWPLAVDTVNFWLDAYQENVVGTLETQFDEFLQTTIRRRSRRR